MTRNKGIAGATLAGIKGGFQKGVPYDESQLNVQNRHCLITGANGGLGKGIAIRMATLGANITMGGRTLDTMARNDIIAVSGNPAVSMETLDLASFQSVLEFCHRMKSNGTTFDIVILNAATMTREGRATRDGLDMMTQVNFLSNVLLIETLLESGVIPNATEGGGLSPIAVPRIVVVSSEAHRWSESIDIDALHQPRSFKMKDAMKVYADTKFMMAAYTAHLAGRLQNENGPMVAVHAHCPGAVNSNLAREAPAFLKPLLKGIFFLFFATPRKASRPAVHLACAPSLAGQSGLYYHMMKEKQFDPRALNSDFQKQLLDKVLQILSPWSI